MNWDDGEIRITGLVRASSYDPNAGGKQFLGAIIEVTGERDWVIAYDEQSPYHGFSGRQVLVTGKPYEPSGERLMRSRGEMEIGHLRVTTMRLAEVTPDATVVEVGAEQERTGRLARQINDTGESVLYFIAETSDKFIVLNDPAGATLNRSIQVCAYPIQPSRSNPGFDGRYLWIICPYSYADLWDWRQRRS